MTAFDDDWSTQPEYLDALTLQWVYALSVERYGVNGYSPLAISMLDLTAAWTFSANSSPLFKLSRAKESPDRWVASALTNDTPGLPSLLAEAARRASAKDNGPGVWFQSELVADAPDLMPPMGIQLARAWQDAATWSGQCRLAPWILLDIDANEGAGDLPIRSTLQIRARYRIPSPGQGPLAMHLAHVWADVIRLVCVFIFGRAIPGQPGARECSPDEKAEAEGALSEATFEVLQLFGVPLNLDDFFGMAGVEGFNKVRSSMTAYDAAINQSNADVATILFVTGMEALVQPNTPHTPASPTTQFVKGISSLAIPCVDGLVHDEGVAAAFGLRWRGGPARRRRDFLNAIYSARSRPAHGSLGNMVSWIDSMGSPQAHRVAVLSVLHRHALMTYWAQPRSFLFGLDPESV